jgi:hypothetical protein
MFKQLFQLTENCSKHMVHNCNYLQRVQVTIHNASKVHKNSFYPSIYEATLQFKKEDVYITKTFYSNFVEDLSKDIQDYLSNEIKL